MQKGTHLHRSCCDYGAGEDLASLLRLVLICRSPLGALLQCIHECAGDANTECKDVVGEGAEAKFKAAQAKAQQDGVEMLTQKDIEGLSLEQIKQLRGVLKSLPD
jgi:hypothetical protein